MLNIIIHDQTRFFKGIFIFDNVIAIWEAMEWVRIKVLKALFIEFEKSYDRVDWDFIISMLKSLGLDPFFCQSNEISLCMRIYCVYFH